MKTDFKELELDEFLSLTDEDKIAYFKELKNKIKELENQIDEQSFQINGRDIRC